jgi:GNAT superfamily N-acetyltransferase
MPERRRDLDLSVMPTADLTPALREEIVGVCNRAFAHDPAQDFTNLFVEYVTDSVHVIAFESEALVAHACYATRWLEPEGFEPLRTAYVDAVATEPGLQRRGIGRAVMERLAEEASGYQLNALSADEAVGFYERLGWERWQGPTAVRQPQGPEPTPNDIVLIRRTASTPPLDSTRLLIADYRKGQPW